MPNFGGFPQWESKFGIDRTYWRLRRLGKKGVLMPKIKVVDNVSDSDWGFVECTYDGEQDTVTEVIDHDSLYGVRDMQGWTLHDLNVWLSWEPTDLHPETNHQVWVDGRWHSSLVGACPGCHGDSTTVPCGTCGGSGLVLTHKITETT